MEELVRPFAAPQDAAGFRAPSTRGVNSDAPELVFGEGSSGQTDEGPYARIDEPEDYGWWPRLKMLISGVEEVLSDWISVSGSVTIDPNICSIWRLRCQSSSLSISFEAIETPSWIERLLIWRDVKRVASLEIIVEWVGSTTGTRSLTLSGVRFANGEAPTWSLSATRDVVLVQITSDGEKYGFPAGTDMRVPS